MKCKRHSSDIRCEGNLATQTTGITANAVAIVVVAVVIMPKSSTGKFKFTLNIKIVKICI